LSCFTARSHRLFSQLPPLEAVAHEASRIFCDLLVASHSDAFDGILVSSMKTEWSYTPPPAAPCDDGSYFVSFAPSESSSGGGLRALQKINEAQMRSLLDAALLGYSREFAKLDLPLYPESLVRLSAIDRVLSNPGGSLILAGRSGASRRALVTLAAYMLKIEIVTPKVSRSYTTKHFKQDIKTVLQMAGGAEARSVVLLLEDHQFVEDSFYELVNSILSTGEIPGLFKPDELDVIIGPLKDTAAQEGWRGSVYSYFLSRVRSNLKVVMILDSSRWDFHQKCESNPAFYSSCTMLWMDRLRPESMGHVTRLSIGSSFDALGHGAASGGAGAKEVPALARTIHESFADKGVTPKHFANMLQLSASIFSQKLTTLRTQEQRFESGLAKLHEATSMVDELKAKALVQSKQLSQKKSEAEQTMVDIQDNMGRASRQKIDIETIKEQLAVEETKLAQRKKAIDAELSSIEPLLEAARSAVGQIKSDSLSEIRALRAPPDTIRDILQGVLGLMGIYDTSWGSMRNFLAKRGVTEDIIHFDARRVTPEMRERVQELIRTRESSFQAENAKRANVAAAPLAKWVLANMQFSEVLEKIGPLEAESNKLQQHLQQSQDRLKSLSADLEAIDKTVRELTSRYGVCTTECARLQLEFEQSQSVITSAEGLISKLDGERQRWAEQAKTIKTNIASLPLKSLLAAGFITYLGDATEDVREGTLQQWAAAAHLSSFDFLGFMSSESEQLSWKAEGLPSDRLSLENAAAMLASSQPPLLVDPGQRATEWLRKHMKEARFEVVNQQDANFVTALELALRFGKKLLIQEADSIEPLLMPILRRDLVPQGPRFCIYVGDKLVDFNEDFQLFISTRNSEFDVGPHLRGIVNTINFTTTRAGLANQLLVRTIQHEKPQLEVCVCVCVCMCVCVYVLCCPLFLSSSLSLSPPFLPLFLSFSFSLFLSLAHSPLFFPRSARASCLRPRTV
jgi:dynein heavy chain 2, cytosolic